MTTDITWPVSFDSCRDCSALDEVEDRSSYERLAINFLSAWTNHQFGLRAVRYRPIGPDCFPAPTTFQGRGPRTMTALGAPYAPGLPRHPMNSRRSQRTALHLPCAQEILSVRLDGELVPMDAYELEDETLFRVDGSFWPATQNLDLPASQEGTFEIEYLRGKQVPEGGQIAAGLLACEFAKAACGDDDCQLPERVQTVTRQGVTVAVMDQFEDLEKGHTGIWLVDSWVASVTAPAKPSRVLSPDMKRRGR